MNTITFNLVPKTANELERMLAALGEHSCGCLSAREKRALFNSVRHSHDMLHMILDKLSTSDDDRAALAKIKADVDAQTKAINDAVEASTPKVPTP